MVLDKPGTYYTKSRFFQKHLDPKVYMFLGFQIRNLMVHCIVAFRGKMVSSSYGLNEP
jgi:hypothetical protein